MTASIPAVAPPAYRWAARGDLNAFFGLMLDNISCMILMASLLVGFGFPREFVLNRMIPGTAVGVLVGDLLYTAMAFRLARRTGRSDVTAMPLGLDTPSTFGTVFLVLGPAFAAARGRGLDAEAAARHAWFLGIAMLLASGVFKLACAPLSGWIRRVVPRAGLLGSLAAIALVIISFLPMREIVAEPISGLTALAVILATLTARWRLPRGIPGALAAVVVGCLVYYGLALVGLGAPTGESALAMPGLRAALPLPIAEWSAWVTPAWREVVGYLPVALPLALATVVGGIDCTESAAAAGDDYPTGAIIGVEGLATLAGGLFGGVIQSTPYIGHPAYKAMGARAAYTLATALFVGGAGVFGYFGSIFALIPPPVVYPILIFVGLEITAQSFHATPIRHYPAIGLACVPALAYLGVILVGQVVGEVTGGQNPAFAGRSFADFSLSTRQMVQTLTMLSGGFIVTSLLWATGLARMIDGRARGAALAFAIAGVLALFGVIHSPLSSSPIAPPSAVVRLLEAEPGRMEATSRQTPYRWAAAYLGMALTALAIGGLGMPPEADEAEVPKAI